MTSAGHGTRWSVEIMRAGVDELHGKDMPGDPTPTLVWMRPTRPALVLGSGQRTPAVDDDSATRLGLDIVRRRSGGGAVLIRPNDVLWCDVFLPAGDRAWSEDLGRTFLTVGGWWRDAFESMGVPAEIATRRPDQNSVSDAVCFAGLGWGEISVGPAKVVGLSQRRTRWGARVQAMAIRRPQVEAVAEMLSALWAQSEAAEPPLRIGAQPSDAGFPSDTMDQIWPSLSDEFLAAVLRS